MLTRFAAHKMRANACVNATVSNTTLPSDGMARLHGKSLEKRAEDSDRKSMAHANLGSDVDPEALKLVRGSLDVLEGKQQFQGS